MSKERAVSNCLVFKQVTQALSDLNFEYQIEPKLNIKDIDQISIIRIPIYIKPCDVFPKGMIIDVRNQDGRGTIYEKFPLFLFRAMFIYPCPVVFVMEGLQFRKEDRKAANYRNWFKQEIERQKENEASVMWLHEFNSWIRSKAKKRRELTRA